MGDGLRILLTSEQNRSLLNLITGDVLLKIKNHRRSDQIKCRQVVFVKIQKLEITSKTISHCLLPKSGNILDRNKIRLIHLCFRDFLAISVISLANTGFQTIFNVKNSQVVVYLIILSSATVVDLLGVVNPELLLRKQSYQI